jgi:rhodanese-related sulfurtransferase
VPAIEAPVPVPIQMAAAPLPEPGSETITLSELDRLRTSGEPVLVLDVRTERSIETSETMAQGAIRMPPEHVVEQARELKLPKEAWLIAYCA